MPCYKASYASILQEYRRAMDIHLNSNSCKTETARWKKGGASEHNDHQPQLIMGEANIGIGLMGWHCQRQG
jgi:hypothetical protein